MEEVDNYIIKNTGDKKGLVHREGDLPAYESTSGLKIWYKEGDRHREIGPAIMKENGEVKYYLKGLLYDEDEFKVKTKFKNQSIKLKNCVNIIIKRIKRISNEI